jgi:hypothetical protein
MKSSITFDSGNSFFTDLRTLADRTAEVSITRLKNLTKEAALEIINQLIYYTPERGYTRTGDLKASINTFAVPSSSGSGWTMLLVFGGVTAPYAPENELGTNNRKQSPQDILNAAQAAPQELIILEYGSMAGSGLEARPVFYPSFVMASRALPIEVSKVLAEQARALGFA